MLWRKWPPWQARIQKQAKAERIKRESERYNAIVAAINSIAHEFATSRQQQQTEAPSKTSREKWTIGGLFFAASIALIALGLSVYQIWESQQNFEADHRAWIAPQHASSKPLVVNTEVRTEIQFFNTGRQPATDVTSYIGYSTIDVPDQNRQEFTRNLEDLSKKCERMPQTASGVMYPSTGGTSYTIVSNTPKEMIDAGIVGGQSVLAVYGCVTYRTFTSTHHSHFCVFYQATKVTSDSWGFCTVGNYAD